MVKLIISGLGFYFHTYNQFSFVKAQGFFFILKHFVKLVFFFKTQGLLKKTNSMFSKIRVFFCKLKIFFWKPSFFYRLEQYIYAHVIYLSTTIAGSKKMNKMALMIKIVFICFMLHVPLDSNY